MSTSSLRRATVTVHVGEEGGSPRRWFDTLLASARSGKAITPSPILMITTQRGGPTTLDECGDKRSGGPWNQPYAFSDAAALHDPLSHETCARIPGRAM